MIKLEYDVNTSGTRVSFVFHAYQTDDADGDASILFKLGKIEDAICRVPQTFETLDAVAILIKAAQRETLIPPYSSITKER